MSDSFPGLYVVSPGWGGDFLSIWTQSDIENLKAALSTGVLSVKYSGPPERTIVYQSLRDMRDLLAEMVANVEDAAGTRQKYRKASTKKGFYP